MKNGRMISIALAVMDVALAAVCVALYLGTDREEPRFEFQNAKVIYQQGMEISALLEGIAAFDDEDGDVTERIVIEKIMENREGNSVVVFYAASDSAGNVGKCTREFQAVFESEESAGLDEMWHMQSGVWAALDDTGGESSRREAEESQGREEASGNSDADRRNDEM